jgi:hypothetical protein
MKVAVVGRSRCWWSCFHFWGSSSRRMRCRPRRGSARARTTWGAWRERESISWDSLRWVFPLMGGGMFVAFWALSGLGDERLKPAFGVLVLLLAAGELIAMRRPAPSPTPSDDEQPASRVRTVVALLGAGVVQGVYACGGPLLVYATGREGLAKESFRSPITTVWVVLGERGVADPLGAASAGQPCRHPHRRPPLCAGRRAPLPGCGQRHARARRDRTHCEPVGLFRFWARVPSGLTGRLRGCLMFPILTGRRSRTGRGVSGSVPRCRCLCTGAPRRTRQARQAEHADRRGEGGARAMLQGVDGAAGAVSAVAAVEALG